MTTDTKPPTKTDLIHLVARLQNLIGTIMSVNHDRNPNREAEVRRYLEKAHDICQEVRNAFKEKIRKQGNHWTDASNDRKKDNWI